MGNGYPNHYEMKKIRIIRLQETKGKCEICGNKANIVHHIDESNDNHSKDNLLVVCSSCHFLIHAKEGGRVSRSTMALRQYGQSYADMAKKYGGKIGKYTYMHQTGKLVAFLKNPSENVGYSSKFVRLYGLSLKGLAKRYDKSQSEIYTMHQNEKLKTLVREYPVGLKKADGVYPVSTAYKAIKQDCAGGK